MKPAWNKGKYGEKTRNFLAGLPNFCQPHGTHYDWLYDQKNRNIRCRPCTNEKNKLFQSDPKRKLARLLYDAKKHSKKFGRICSITLQDLSELRLKQKNRCAISGIEFIDKDKFFNISLDRIDSSKDYVKENIQFLCIIINRMKTDLPQEVFINLCLKISEKYAAARKNK